MILLLLELNRKYLLFGGDVGSQISFNLAPIAELGILLLVMSDYGLCSATVMSAARSIHVVLIWQDTRLNT